MFNVLRPDASAFELLLRKLSASRQIRPDSIAPFGRLDDLKLAHDIGAALDDLKTTRLVGSGVVGEVRTLPDGRRQIMMLRLPGDLTGPGVSHEPCEIVALTPAATFSAQPFMDALLDRSPRYDELRESWAATRWLEEVRMADQMLRLGRLRAHERIGHLFLELYDRLHAVGLAANDTFHLPLTQLVLADLLGLSVVHVNRMLLQLRRQGVITLRAGSVQLRQRDKLMQMSSYVERRPADPRRRQENDASVTLDRVRHPGLGDPP